MDRPTGVPALAQMVTEGVEIPGPTDLSEAPIAAAERHACTTGATKLRVGVLSENAAALALYQRAGFTGYLLTLTQRLEPDSSTRRRV